MKAHNVLSILISLLILPYLAISAENEIFSVITTHGNVQVQRNNSPKWDKLMTGSRIYASDKIKIGDKSYLNLFNSKQGRNLELKTSGDYSADKLVSMLPSKKTSLASRFVGYVADNLKEKNYMLVGEDYKKNMQATGAVERGIAPEAQSCKPGVMSSEIKLCVPRKNNFFGNTFTLSWQLVQNVKKYIFILTDRFDRIVETKDVTGNSIQINADQMNLQKDVYYFWHVVSQSDSNIKSDDCCFLVLSDVQIKELNETVVLMKDELGQEKSAFNCIVLGNFYEQNFLMDDARKLYKEAVDIQPDVDAYQEIYKSFLNRSNYNN